LSDKEYLFNNFGIKFPRLNFYGYDFIKCKLEKWSVSIMNKRYNSVLAIAGSDSGGGAGIQADIKSISANGAYAATVITASTAQNTQGVTDIHPLPIEHIEAQLDAVLSDITFGAIKIGMLHSTEVINKVKETLKKYAVENIILDPVMIASSGDKLLDENAINALKEFLPHLYLLTPNVPEAEILLGYPIGLKNIKKSAKEIGETFAISVLLKGGHLESREEMTDTLYIHESKEIITIHNPSIQTKNTHGTGCSLSSAIATYVSLGYPLKEAVIKSCAYVNEAIEAGKDKQLGEGNSPINHFKLSSIEYNKTKTGKIMEREEIIQTLKATYSREIRKGLIRTILEKEKKDNALEIQEQYKIINQIFSYVLQQSGWTMGENSSLWDSSPLDTMREVFPKISTTKWYEEQLLTTNQKVKVAIQEK